VQRHDPLLTAAEREVIIIVLSSCPDQPLPARGGIPGSPATLDQVTPGQAPASDSPTSSPSPGSTPATGPTGLTGLTGPTVSVEAPISGPMTVPVVPSVEEEVVYAKCAEVKAAGAAPIRVGDPGLRNALDSDSNGIGCESCPTPTATATATASCAGTGTGLAYHLIDDLVSLGPGGRGGLLHG
jgi:hypothetical protein